MPHRKPMEYRESLLQEHFCHYLDSKGILYNASMSGVNLGITSAIRRKRMGARKGFPDLFLYEPTKIFNGMAIELKAGSGAVTPEQKTWQQELQKRGYYAVIMPAGMNFVQALAWLKNCVEEYLRG